MRINISDITKVDEASLEVEFNDKLEGLEEVIDEFVFNQDVSFSGRLTNLGGILKLDGSLLIKYSTKCYRCLRDLCREINIKVRESYISIDKKENSEEAYTYEGNYIIIDKALKDNIILNLPMKQVCTERCKGLCHKCGTDLNEQTCECKEEEINPKMEILKDFFNN